MTHTSRPAAPPTPAPAPAVATTLHRLGRAWGEALAASAISLAWSTLRLWDYPRPAPGQGGGAVPPEPG
jgi:hypothetical protein